MTSAGGRKQRFCVHNVSTNQLGGEIPTPLTTFANFQKLSKSQNRSAHQKRKNRKSYEYDFCGFLKNEKTGRNRKTQKAGYPIG